MLAATILLAATRIAMADRSITSGSGNVSTINVTGISAGYGLISGVDSGGITLSLSPDSTQYIKTTASNTYVLHSSATVSYLGISSSTLTELTRSSAAVSYLGISSAPARINLGNPVTGTLPIANLTANATNYIQNTSSPQTATFNVSSGSIDGQTFVTDASNNRIGIGTTTPQAQLHVWNTSDSRIRAETASTGAVGQGIFANPSTSHSIGIETTTDSGGGGFSGNANSFNIEVSGANRLYFSNNATARMYLDGGTLQSNTAGGMNLGSSTNYWGQVFMADGSASAPAYAFGTATQSGWFNNGGNIALSIANSNRLQVSGTRTSITAGHLMPNSAGSQNFGDATDYWGDISYKTLTDRGCLGWFDEGVDMPDGTKVNDLAVFGKLKLHPRKQTVYGVPMLDYRSFPKVAYKPATYQTADGKEVAYPRDENDDPHYYEIEDPNLLVVDRKRYYAWQDIPAKERPHAIKRYAQDGIEMTSMQSIMIGALKEASERIDALEEHVRLLQNRVTALEAAR